MPAQINNNVSTQFKYQPPVQPRVQVQNDQRAQQNQRVQNQQQQNVEQQKVQENKANEQQQRPAPQRTGNIIDLTA